MKWGVKKKGKYCKMLLSTTAYFQVFLSVSQCVI